MFTFSRRLVLSSLAVLALAACALCCQRYLERRIDRLAARVGKKDTIQPLGHQIGNAAGQFKGEGVAKLKCRAEIHRCRGFCNCFDNRGAAMPGIAAPQARSAIENAVPGDIPIMHVLRCSQLARVCLIGSVGSEGHPECRKRIVFTHQFGPCWVPTGTILL